MSGIRKKAGTSQLLFAAASKMGLDPSWLTPNGLFVVSTEAGERYVNRGMSSLNSHVSTSLSRNKHLTRVVLGRHGLPNIPYIRPKTALEAENFLARYGTIIVKPLTGSGAKDIHVVSSSEQLAVLNIEQTIIEQYIPGMEMRYLLLNGSVIGVHESRYGNSVDEHRDLERVSFASSSWDPVHIEMAERIGRVLGLKFAAVDFMIDKDNQIYILEVNSNPGFKWFHAPSEGPVVDVAGLFLKAMLA